MECTEKPIPFCKCIVFIKYYKHEWKMTVPHKKAVMNEKTNWIMTHAEFKVDKFNHFNIPDGRNGAAAAAFY